MKIIDAHAHLWLRQDTEVNGMKIRSILFSQKFCIFVA